MTHELSSNPIKLRLVNLKNGEWSKSFIYVGSVPSDIEKELHKVEKEYNNSKSVRGNVKLKKFYGSNWQNVLGLVKQESKKGGGSASVDNVDSEHNAIFQCLPADFTSAPQASFGVEELWLSLF